MSSFRIHLFVGAPIPGGANTARTMKISTQTSWCIGWVIGRVCLGIVPTPGWRRASIIIANNLQGEVGSVTCRKDEDESRTTNLSQIPPATLSHLAQMTELLFEDQIGHRHHEHTPVPVATSSSCTTPTSPKSVNVFLIGWRTSPL